MAPIISRIVAWLTGRKKPISDSFIWRFWWARYVRRVHDECDDAKAAQRRIPAIVATR